MIDDVQDWVLLSGHQNESHTCVTFQRPFLTCDYETDLPITNDVTKLIWAYDEEDPVGSSALISKHDLHRRGHKSVHLLSHKYEQSSHKEQDHVQTWDITSSELLLPNDSDTTYWCKIVTPPFFYKAHVIRVSYFANYTVCSKTLFLFISMICFCLFRSNQSFHPLRTHHLCTTWSCTGVCIQSPI